MNTSTAAIVSLAIELITRAGFDVLDFFEQKVAGGKHSFVSTARDPRELPFRRDMHCIVIVATDLCPWFGQADLRRRNPAIDNDRVYRIDELNSLLRKADPDGSFALALEGMECAIAVTVNSEAAWAFLEEAAPARIAAYRKEVTRRWPMMLSPFPILEEMTAFGNNARTYLVAYGGGKAVCKVFRPGRERQFRNELRGLQLAKRIPEIPKCLEVGENWLLAEYASDAKPLSSFKNHVGLLPLPYVREAFRVLRAMHDAGVAHLDFRPDHVLIQPNGRLVIIDFDRLHTYDTIPAFEDSFAVIGYEEGSLPDAPNGPPATYIRVWQPHTGLSFSMLYNGTPALQHLSRCRVSARRLAAAAVRALTKRVSREPA